MHRFQHDALDWIAIYAADDTPGTHGPHDWVFHHGTTDSGGDLAESGTVEVTPTDSGEYFVVMFADNTYREITDRLTISVEAAAAPDMCPPAAGREGGGEWQNHSQRERRSLSCWLGVGVLLL